MTEVSVSDLTNFKWATVTTAWPNLAITIDGDAGALLATPDSLVDPQTLVLGDRVRIEMTDRKVVIHGKSAGTESSPGDMKLTARQAAPAGWLLCQGQAVSRTTYPKLFAALNPVLGIGTVTIATPGVWTYASHGLATGQAVYLTTTGALPTGLSPSTVYYVIVVDANTFRLATSYANAVAGTAIATSGTQSGAHTIYRTWGVGDGSTTFNVPDMRGRVAVGLDSSQAEFDALGEAAGTKAEQLTAAQMPSHVHNDQYVDATLLRWGISNAVGGSGIGFVGNWGSGSNVIRTGSAGSDQAHNNLPPYRVVNYLIKT